MKSVILFLAILGLVPGSPHKLVRRETEDRISSKMESDIQKITKKLPAKVKQDILRSSTNGTTSTNYFNVVDNSSQFSDPTYILGDRNGTRYRVKLVKRGDRKKGKSSTYNSTYDISQDDSQSSYAAAGDDDVTRGANTTGDDRDFKAYYTENGSSGSKKQTPRNKIRISQKTTVTTKKKLQREDSDEGDLTEEPIVVSTVGQLPKTRPEDPAEDNNNAKDAKLKEQIPSVITSAKKSKLQITNSSSSDSLEQDSSNKRDSSIITKKGNFKQEENNNKDDVETESESDKSLNTEHLNESELRNTEKYKSDQPIKEFERESGKADNIDTAKQDLETAVQEDKRLLQEGDKISANTVETISSESKSVTNLDQEVRKNWLEKHNGTLSEKVDNEKLVENIKESNDLIKKPSEDLALPNKLVGNKSEIKMIKIEEKINPTEELTKLKNSNESNRRIKTVSTLIAEDKESYGLEVTDSNEIIHTSQPNDKVSGFRSSITTSNIKSKEQYEKKNKDFENLLKNKPRLGFGNIHEIDYVDSDESNYKMLSDSKNDDDYGFADTDNRHEMLSIFPSHEELAGSVLNASSNKNSKEQDNNVNQDFQNIKKEEIHLGSVKENEIELISKQNNSDESQNKITKLSSPVSENEKSYGLLNTDSNGQEIMHTSNPNDEVIKGSITNDLSNTKSNVKDEKESQDIRNLIREEARLRSGNDDEIKELTEQDSSDKSKLPTSDADNENSSEILGRDSNGHANINTSLQKNETLKGSNINALNKTKSRVNNEKGIRDIENILRREDQLGFENKNKNELTIEKDNSGESNNIMTSDSRNGYKYVMVKTNKRHEILSNPASNKLVIGSNLNVLNNTKSKEQNQKGNHDFQNVIKKETLLSSGNNNEIELFTEKENSDDVKKIMTNFTPSGSKDKNSYGIVDRNSNGYEITHTSHPNNEQLIGSILNTVSNKNSKEQYEKDNKHIENIIRKENQLDSKNNNEMELTREQDNSLSKSRFGDFYLHSYDDTDSYGHEIMQTNNQYGEDLIGPILNTLSNTKSKVKDVQKNEDNKNLIWKEAQFNSGNNNKTKEIIEKDNPDKSISTLSLSDAENITSYGLVDTKSNGHVIMHTSPLNDEVFVDPVLNPQSNNKPNEQDEKENNNFENITTKEVQLCSENKHENGALKIVPVSYNKFEINQIYVYDPVINGNLNSDMSLEPINTMEKSIIRQDETIPIKPLNIRSKTKGNATLPNLKVNNGVEIEQKTQTILENENNTNLVDKHSDFFEFKPMPKNKRIPKTSQLPLHKAVKPLEPYESTPWYLVEVKDLPFDDAEKYKSNQTTSDHFTFEEFLQQFKPGPQDVKKNVFQIPPAHSLLEPHPSTVFNILYNDQIEKPWTDRKCQSNNCLSHSYTLPKFPAKLLNPFEQTTSRKAEVKNEESNNNESEYNDNEMNSAKEADHLYNFLKDHIAKQKKYNLAEVNQPVEANRLLFDENPPVENDGLMFEEDEADIAKVVHNFEKRHLVANSRTGLVPSADKIEVNQPVKANRLLFDKNPPVENDGLMFEEDESDIAKVLHNFEKRHLVANSRTGLIPSADKIEVNQPVEDNGLLFDENPRAENDGLIFDEDEVDIAKALQNFVKRHLAADRRSGAIPSVDEILLNILKSKIINFFETLREDIKSTFDNMWTNVTGKIVDKDS